MLPRKLFPEKPDIYFPSPGANKYNEQKWNPNDIDYSASSRRLTPKQSPNHTLSPITSRGRISQFNQTEPLVGFAKTDNASMIFNDFMDFSTRLKEKSKDLIVTEHSIAKLYPLTPNSRSDAPASAYRTPNNNISDKNFQAQTLFNTAHNNLNDEWLGGRQATEFPNPAVFKASNQVPEYYPQTPSSGFMENEQYLLPNPNGYSNDEANTSKIGGFKEQPIIDLGDSHENSNLTPYDANEGKGFSANIFLQVFESSQDKEAFIETLSGRDSNNVSGFFHKGKITFEEISNKFTLMTMSPPLYNIPFLPEETISVKFIIINKYDNLICLSIDLDDKDESARRLKHIAVFTLNGNVFDFIENKFDEYHHVIPQVKLHENSKIEFSDRDFRNPPHNKYSEFQEFNIHEKGFSTINGSSTSSANFSKDSTKPSFEKELMEPSFESTYNPNMNSNKQNNSWNAFNHGKPKAESSWNDNINESRNFAFEENGQIQAKGGLYQEKENASLTSSDKRPVISPYNQEIHDQVNHTQEGEIDNSTLNETQILSKLPKDYLSRNKFKEIEGFVPYTLITVKSTNNKVTKISGGKNDKLGNLQTSSTIKIGVEPVERSRNSARKHSQKVLNSLEVQEVEDEKRNDIANNKNLTEEEEEDEENSQGDDLVEKDKSKQKTPTTKIQESTNNAMQINPPTLANPNTGFKKEETTTQTATPAMISPPPQLNPYEKTLSKPLNDKQITPGQTVFSKNPKDSSQNNQVSSAAQKIEINTNKNPLEIQNNSALAMEDQLKIDKTEFQKVSETLKKGKNVIKYGRNSILGPGKRTLSMTTDNINIALGKNNTGKVSKSFEIVKIQDLKKGKETQNFQKYKKAKVELCMSILYVNRSIDLELANEQDFKELYDCLKKIIDLKKKYNFNPEFRLK